jgi:hypothetical protein
MVRVVVFKNWHCEAKNTIGQKYNFYLSLSLADLILKFKEEGGEVIGVLEYWSVPPLPSYQL